VNVTAFLAGSGSTHVIEAFAGAGNAGFPHETKISGNNTCLFPSV
jgi:hypothetical protein